VTPYYFIDMDEKQNDRQHDTLFKRTDDHEKRLIKLEIDHDYHRDRTEEHGGKIDTHAGKLSRHSDWITRIAVGGLVILYLADKAGFWDKF